RPHAPQLRSAIERGNRQVPPLRRRSRRLSRKLWRSTLGRTWRRTGARRTPSENVRPRINGGLPQIQDRLGSRLEDEPRQADQSQQDRRKPPPRRELLPLGAANSLPVPARSWQPLARRSALRRRR